MTASVESKSAGAEFATFVAEELEAEDKRRASLEARGLAVVTTAGSIVTLVLALVALVSEREGFQLPEGAHAPLVASLVGFVVAAAAGIVTNAPLLYRAVDATALEIILRKRWSQPGDDALKTITVTRLEHLRNAQRANDLKGWVLLVAISVEGLAIAFLVWTAVTVLRAP